MTLNTENPQSGNESQSISDEEVGGVAQKADDAPLRVSLQNLMTCRHQKNTTKELFWLVSLLMISILPALFSIWFGHSVIAWMWMMIWFFLFIIKLGQYSLCRPMGIFINERNLMSLSRLQIVAWTILIISALLVMVFVRLLNGIVDPFDIAIDWQIWAVLGLSASAAVGAPLINSSKGMKQPLPAPQSKGGKSAQKVSPSVEKAATAFNQSVQEVEQSRTGVLYGNPDPKDARFTDIFEGDELTNAMYIDIAKVQMFWFSIIAIAGYAILLLNFLLKSTPDELISFPVFSEGFVAILTVSHATYLGGKGFTQTPSTG